MTPLQNVQTALVTGASGGIGEAFARQLAGQGKDLVLVARSEDKLRALAEELATLHGVQTHVLVRDLARTGGAAALYDDTERLRLVVDLLVNNAGFGKAGEFTELPFDAQADMVRLNVNSLMELTRLYLPAMRQRKRGGVINLGSAGSFQPIPIMAVYGATKAFVLSFSEALAEEVAVDGVTVMALCPGSVATGFQAAAGVYEDDQGSMVKASEVVAEALRAFDRQQAVYVPQFRYRAAVFFSTRLLPRRLVTRLAARVVGGNR